jgi:glycosyltransferase involved in cell wall biosynthesis
MHILFVEPQYPNISGDQGGAGTYVRNVGLELIKRGHKVSVLRGGNQLIENSYRIDQGIKVYSQKLKSNLSWFACRTPVINKLLFPLIQYLMHGLHKYIYINRINKMDRIDIIEYSSTGDFWQCIFKSIPYIVHLHGSGFSYKNYLGKKMSNGEKLMNKFEGMFYKNSKHIFSPSKWILNQTEMEIRTKFKCKSLLKYPITNTLINEKGNKNKIVFFMAGRNDPTKGWGILIEAIKSLDSKILAKSKFVFYGLKPGGNFIIPKNVQIHPFTKRLDVLVALNGADVVIVPSWVDNSPYTIYEAMSFAKPVIGSNIGGIPELIKHKFNGLLFNDRNKAELKNAIEYMIKYPKKKRQMGNNAIKYINDECDLNSNISNRLKIWLE